MDKELKRKLFEEIIKKIPLMSSLTKEKLVEELLAVDDMDTPAQEAYILEAKIAEKKALEVEVAKAQATLETAVPRLNDLIKELPAEVVEKVEEPVISTEEPVEEPIEEPIEEPVEPLVEEEIIEP